MIHASFFRAVNEPAADPRSFSWDAFAEFIVNSRRVTPSKEGVPLFNCTAFSTPYRAKANVVNVSALVLDLDDQPGAFVRGLLEKLSPHAFVFYTTHRHVGEPVRARAIVRLSRPVHAYEWDRFVASTKDWLGDQFDKCLANPSQAYYLPSCPPETAAQAQTFAWQGAPVDVDQALEKAPAIIARTPLLDVSPSEWRPEVSLTKARLIEIAKMKAAVGFAARRALVGEELSPRGTRHDTVRDLVYACTKEYGPCTPDDEVMALLEASCPNPPDKPQADATWWRAQFSAWGMRSKAEAEHAAEKAQRATNARVEAALMAHARPAAGDAPQGVQSPGAVDTLVAAAFAEASGGVPYTEAELKKQAKRCHNEAQKQVLDTILTGAGVLDEYVPHIEAAGRWLGKRELGRKLEDLKAPFLRYVLDPPHRAAFCRGLELGQQEGLLREPWRTQCQPTADGEITASEVNAGIVLRLHPDMQGVLAFDERRGEPVLLRAPPWRRSGTSDVLEEWDANAAAEWLKEVTRRDFPSNLVWHALQFIANEVRFDPLQVWADALRWDGVPRCDTWLTAFCGAEDTPLHRALGAKLMIAGAARIFAPGCKFDNVLVLEGKEGVGKTEIVRNLAPPGRYQVTEGKMVRGDKDALANIVRGPLVVEWGELGGLSSADQEQVKKFITQITDKFRDPYARKAREYPRRIVFLGTTNDSQYLVSNTGGRRWWPVPVGVCDPAGLAAVRDQLWAEAVHRYRAGEPWWFPGEPPAELRQAQRARVIELPYEDELQHLLEGEGPLRPGMLAQALGVVGPVPTQQHNILRKLLTRYGWVQDQNKSRHRGEENPTRWWWRRE